LSWQNNSSDYSAIEIDRSTDGVYFNEIGSLPAGSSSYADAGLTAGTQYWYQVESIGWQDGTSTPATASATTNIDLGLTASAPSANGRG
jgi:hypothetical protein